MQKNQGIALIVVLIFLQVLTILGLGAMQMTLFETKQAQMLWKKHVIENLADRALMEVEHDLSLAIPACQIQATAASELASHPISWWQNLPACSSNLETVHYFYVVEFLGVDPCAVIQTTPSKVIANYYRISLLAISGNSKFLFQTSYVTPNYDSGSVMCLGVAHQVRMGRQMWRRI